MEKAPSMQLFDTECVCVRNIVECESMGQVLALCPSNIPYYLIQVLDPPMKYNFQENGEFVAAATVAVVHETIYL